MVDFYLKISLNSSKLVASPEIHQYLCPCILHNPPSMNRFGAIFFPSERDSNLGTDHNTLSIEVVSTAVS